MYPEARIAELRATPAQAGALALAVLLAVSPIPFAGVLPAWGLSVSAAVVLALLLAGWGREFASQVRRLAVPLACLSALGLQAAAQAFLPPARGGSAAPEAALRVASMYLLAALAAAVACGVGNSRRARRLLLAGLVAGVVFQAVYGATNWLHHSTAILGVAVQSQPQRLKGTFVNPNHLATYLVCGLCALQAWGWWSWRQVTLRHRRQAAVWLIGAPVLLWTCVLAVVSLSGSRSGLLAVAAGLGAQALAWFLGSRRSRGAWLAGLVLGLAIAAAVVMLEGWGERGSGMARLAATRLGDVSAAARLEAWKGTALLWLRAPVWGHGAGSFADAFVAVQPAAFAGIDWQHAHNDWLEVLATQGLLGFGLLLAAALTAGKLLWRAARRGYASEDRAAGLFGLGLLAALAVQEFVEFGMTRPANVLTVAVLLGAAAGVRLQEVRASAAEAGLAS